MKKKEWIYIGIITCIFIFLVVVEYNKKEPVTWDITLQNNDKQPFGTYASFELFKELFTDKFTTTRLPIYNLLTEDYDVYGNYIFIQKEFFLDQWDAKELLDFVENGNEVFIAAEFFSSELLDSLGVTVDYISVVEHLQDSIQGITKIAQSGIKDELQLMNDENITYYLSKNYSLLYFSKFDMVATTVLGRSKRQNAPDFIRIQRGDGYFYLNTNPIAFSNYYVLNEKTNQYAFTALSYLPVDFPVIWDEYQKQGRVGEEHELREILAYPPLKWAYYLALAGILIFIVFEGKRRQRIIPVYKPLPNQTVDFAKVIGSLYYNKRNNTDIALKRIAYLQDFIRTNFYESTTNPDQDFINRLAEKTGCDQKFVKELFLFINKIKDQADRDWMSDNDLLKINELIEKFYKCAKNE